MDWPSRVREIQSRFFRPPPYAYLWINFAQDNNMLSWSFTFMEFGMCHTISSSAVVIRKNGCFLVGRESWPSEDMALEAVFGGHLNHFLQEFYRDIGFMEWPKTDAAELTDRLQEHLVFAENT